MSLNCSILNHHGHRFGGYLYSNEYKCGYKDVIGIYEKNQLCLIHRIIKICHKSMFLLLAYRYAIEKWMGGCCFYAVKDVNMLGINTTTIVIPLVHF